ncbi:hypothetical protein G6F57_003702 [Rhizopus arrhizus]|nr:hypothetical protein G6F23_005129 [Rhizopus arrhizus]KAG1428017.1 hypothetical protein G6F58_000770 [Rhizopus delemar]KAG0770615.1 hypothetical protein G6F24_000073 [Rhizopus arrhizus]KAG0793709.1 hypothetical protein G6F21_003419 [Rhizopus arrhizus]KAG0814972.1 hypothetical protein G6F20_004356 [Rhizopus arrhizus]
MIDQIGDLLSKEYEDLTFEEIATRIAENKRQINKLLNLNDTNEEEVQDSSNNWTILFQRATSTGDISKLKEMLSNQEIKSHIDINAGDTPPLIYAACFGKIQVTELLLEAGADINIQDSLGWSALMWATNNNHLSLAQLLLDRGASPQMRSMNGKSVFNFVDSSSLKVTEDSRDSTSSSVSSLFLKTSTCSSSSEHEFDSHGLTENIIGFQWDTCAYDEMLVFKEDDLDFILDLIITHFQLPLSNSEDMYIPANVIFLAARYAYHFSTLEQLEELLNGSFSRIRNMISLQDQKIHLLAFWMSNLTQLLFYLKKDTELVFATVEQQLNLSELMSELFSAITKDIEKRILQIIHPAMLEHETIPGIDQVQFADSWQRFFFRKNTRLSIIQPASNTISPQSITQLLSSILHILQSYQIHSSIITQLFSQIFHFISCEVFNRIITNKKYLCRTKAIQIRMNFSQLEDWILMHDFPTTISNYLTPITQLLQLLQCFTQLEDLLDFIQATQKFDALNMSQIRRCALSYRYEVNERRIPDEIQKYTIQCVQDTVKQQSINVPRASISSGRASTSSGRPNTSFFSRNTHLTPIPEQLPGEENSETKCTKFKLSFTVPTLTQIIREHQTLPSISQEWMDRLDRSQPES